MRNVSIRGILLMLLAVVLVSAASSVQRQDIEDDVSGGFYNGRFWKAIDGQTKILFLKGIEEGIALFYREFLLEIKEQSEKDQATNLSMSLTVSGFMFSEVADQVDSFYDDSSNLRIPVTYGYVYAVKKMKGVEPADLERYISHLRSTWNK